MSAMFDKQQSTFNFPIIASVGLHLLVLVFLSYNAWQYSDTNAGINEGQPIEAIMIDPAVITQEHQRQLEDNIALQQIEKEKQKQREIEKQKQEALSAAKKQAEIDAEKARQKAQKMKEQAEQIAKQKAEAELEAKKAAEAAKQKSAESAEMQALDDAKKAVEQSDLIKELAEQIDKKAKSQKKAEEKAVEDIIGGLTAKKPPAPKGVLDNEQAKYMALVKTAISNRFSNPNLYSGRQCTLTILIASDGLLLDVVSNAGDPHLCRDAIAATRQATIPKPPEKLYNRVREMIIDFQPK